MQKPIWLVTVGLFGMLVACFISSYSCEKTNVWPQRVLITNDNGIDDIKIITLARAFSQIAETYVIAPSGNRSGSSNYITILSEESITVQARFLGNGIKAFGVDGYPADCVLLGVWGIMADNPPDLVISGINGGANLGSDWFGSGTIGAARTAAVCGLPAIAVSGLDDSIPQSVDAASAWVAKLASCELVRELEPGQYLTVSLPRKAPAEVKGIRVVKRAPPLGRPVFIGSQKPEIGPGWTEWALTNWIEMRQAPEDSDVAVYHKDFIVIVPMQVAESAEHFYSQVQSKADKIPLWMFSLNKKK
jgi:5'-nucleotidase